MPNRGKLVFVVVSALIASLQTLAANAAGPVDTYVRFITDLTNQEIAYPVGTTNLEFQVQLSNPNKDVEQITFTLTDATGQTIDSDYNFFFYADGSTKLAKQTLSIYDWMLNKKSLPLMVTTKVSFKSSSGKLSVSDSFPLKVKNPDVNVVCKSGVRLSIAKNTCPAGSILQATHELGRYVSFVVDPRTKSFDYPKTETPIDFQIDVADPEDDLSSIDIDIKDATGRLLDGTLIYSFDGGTVTTFSRTLRITPGYSGIEVPVTMIMTLSFSLSSEKKEISSTFPLNVSPPDIPVDCQLGAKFVRAINNCPAGYTIVAYQIISNSNYTLLSRMPSKLKGKKFTVYGCVAQFDTNTGGKTFRAYVTNKPSSYYSGINSVMTGDAKKLLALKEDDAFVANVQVVGATTYRSLGGYRSAPKLTVLGFLKIGTCL